MKTLLVTLLAGVLLLAGAGCDQKMPQGYHLYARFKQPQPVRAGDPVLRAGMEIGRVQNITLDPAQGTATIAMEFKRTVLVEVDSVASIGSTSSPGKSCIVIHGRGAGAPRATEGTFLRTE